MAIISTILNLILWIWIIQVAAGVLMYSVILGKSFRQHGHSVRHASAAACRRTTRGRPPVDGKPPATRPSA
jgi:beta-lactamase regulating signal transducer with metallopeptidase domain